MKHPTYHEKLLSYLKNALEENTEDRLSIADEFWMCGEVKGNEFQRRYSAAMGVHHQLCNVKDIINGEEPSFA